MSEWKLVPVEPAPSQVASGEYEVPDPLSHRAANVARNVYRAMLDAAPAAPQQAEPASEFQRSAPERIWLNVGDINDEDRFEDVSNDGCEWICWCEDSQDKNDVPYVRADLAPSAPQLVPSEPQEHAEPALTVEVAQDADGGWSLTVPTYFPCMRVGKNDLYLHPPAAEVQRLRAEVEALKAEDVRLRNACSKENDDICQTLGSALGYPKFVDDPAIFPGATEADGVCIGDHVAASLACEAADMIAKLQGEVEALRVDAERYRFVRIADGIRISLKAARDPVVYDAAIDAARAAQGVV